MGKPCMLCNTDVAKNTCKMCGVQVCDNCYDSAKGVCNACRQGKTI